jgi:hypothetical protein
VLGDGSLLRRIHCKEQRPGRPPKRQCPRQTRRAAGVP